jgi:hypothetical protein
MGILSQKENEEEEKFLSGRSAPLCHSAGNYLAARRLVFR